jgi:hypothetical protein
VRVRKHIAFLQPGLGVCMRAYGLAGMRASVNLQAIGHEPERKKRGKVRETHRDIRTQTEKHKLGPEERGEKIEDGEERRLSVISNAVACHAVASVKVALRGFFTETHLTARFQQDGTTVIRLALARRNILVNLECLDLSKLPTWCLPLD